MPTLTLQKPHLDSALQLVDFAQATPSTLTQLTKTALLDASAFLDKLEQNPDTSHDVATALDLIEQFSTLTQQTARYFGIISHLNSVANTDEIRHTHHELLPLISAFLTRSGQSKALYHLYQQVNQGFEQLPPNKQSQAQKQAIKHALQNFDLSGIGLKDDKKAQFAQIEHELALLSAKFADNVMDATAHFAYPLHPEELSGISQSGLALLKVAGERYKKQHPQATLPSDYVATLEMPMYLAIMQYADNRALREKIYHAYNTKASDQSTDSTAFDNSAIMTQIINLRTQKAQLLGMANYSEYSLATKMADTAQQVEDFLLKLSAYAKPKAQEELDEMIAFAKNLGIDKIAPWDLPYLAEKIRLKKFNLDSDSLRPYFPLPVVLAGLFDICHTLFNIRIQQTPCPAWHDDVSFYEIYDDKSNERLGGLYLDLFARHGKQGGAWLSDFQSRKQQHHTTILPVGFIVANFAPPIGDKPSCLSFDEVTTLFHEFGHALHHLLTQVDVSEVAGISGVEWDAVELPSQFMENFALTSKGIDKISRHIKTGEALPNDKREALIRAKHFQTGLQTLRQMEFGLFDLRLHSQITASNINDSNILTIMDKVRQDIAVITPPKNNRFANSFSHIFAGGYACGYYSYIWAEVLSSDAFGKFEEEGIFNPSIGQRFRDEILARGSSRSAKENYRAFRGRDATLDALLRHRGLKSQPS